MQLHGAHKAHKGICGMDERVFIRKIHQNKCSEHYVLGRMLTHKAFGIKIRKCT